MQLISKFIEWIRFLLCVIDIYSKYAWVVPLKDKKAVTIVNAFQKVLDNLKKKKTNKNGLIKLNHIVNECNST